jgi:hypothetical protein
MKKIFFSFAVLFFICIAAARAANYLVEKGNPLPYAAMCSVHVYNVGQEHNPESTADREDMRRVIAIKTNLITREMRKQYDYLDATVKRFQIQLQKAVLVARAEAAGAPAAGSSGGGSSSLSGANDCMNKSRAEMVICLRNNLSLIQSAVNANKDLSMVRKQIESDTRAMTSMTTNKDSCPDCSNNSNICGADKIKTSAGLKACLPCMACKINAIQEYQPASQRTQGQLFQGN